MSSRPLPLHTCGVSIIRIAMKASAAAQDLNGPLGSMAKRIVQIASSATPFIHAFLYPWLVLLSIADSHILAVEGIVEKTFPPSRHVFNKIDELVRVAEELPENFDLAVKRFPTVIRQVPFLDWALVHVISLLELLITILTYWKSEGTREKEIMVDMNCKNRDVGESESAFVTDQAEHESELVIEPDDKPTKSLVHVEIEGLNGEYLLPQVSETWRAETDTACVNSIQDCTKSNYEEVLEIERENNMRKDQNVSDQEETREGMAEEKDERSKDGPIIELFESGWLMKRGRRGK